MATSSAAALDVSALPPEVCASEIPSAPALRCRFTSVCITSLAQIAKAVADFDGSLQHIEVLVSRLQAQPWSQICGPGMAPLDSARMHLMIAYTVNALFWMYLRTQVVDVHDHPVRAELERVKKALRKVKEAEKEAAGIT